MTYTVYIAASGVPQERKAAHAIHATGVHDSEFKLDFEKDSTVHREILKATRTVVKYFLAHRSEISHEKATLRLVTNTGYLLDMWNKNQVEEWETLSWRKKNGDPLSNVDLIKELYTAVQSLGDTGIRTVFTKPQTDKEKLVLKATLKTAEYHRKASV